VVTKGRGSGGGRYLPDPKTMRMSPLYTFPYIQVSTVLMPLFGWGLCVTCHSCHSPSVLRLCVRGSCEVSTE